MKSKNLCGSPLKRKVLPPVTVYFERFLTSNYFSL